MENIISTTFTGLWMVRKGQLWRLVFGAPVSDSYGDTRSLRYVLDGRVYECTNVYCFQRLANDATRFTKEQFDSYINYVIERNYSDVRNIAWKQSLEAKANGPIPMKNAELQNLISLRASEQNIRDEMTKDITGTKGLTYFKCLIK